MSSQQPSDVLAQAVNPASAVNPAQAELLAQLRDIQEPALSGARLAPGWVAVVLTLILLALLLTAYLLARRQRPAWRQAALEELARIRLLCDESFANPGDAVGETASGNFGVDDNDSKVRQAHVVAQCSKLLRRCALSLVPRQEVAAVSGEAWLGILDRLHGSHHFSSGVGRILAEMPYQRPLDGTCEELDELLELVDDFVRNSVNSRLTNVGGLPRSPTALDRGGVK